MTVYYCHETVMCDNPYGDVGFIYRWSTSWHLYYTFHISG